MFLRSTSPLSPEPEPKQIDAAVLTQAQEVLGRLSQVLNISPKLWYEGGRVELWKRFRTEAGPKIDELLGLVGGDKWSMYQIFRQIPSRDWVCGSQVVIRESDSGPRMRLEKKPGSRIRKPEKAITKPLHHAFDLVYYSWEGEAVWTHARIEHNWRTSREDAWTLFVMSAREHGFANPKLLYEYLLAQNDFYSS